MPIRILPDHLVNQIKAGEVIERPSHVLKEILDNSLDSNPKNISVSIHDGGLSLIQVIDDGFGISYDDLPLVFEKHATSKISQFSDLESLSSFGFRGEALASIASVSNSTITSKCLNSEAFSISCNGGVTSKILPASLNVGTKIDVQDLFFYVPARRKFLKNSATEFNYCKSVFLRAAISNPSVSFTLRKDKKNFYHFTSSNQEDRVKQIINSELLKTELENTSISFQAKLFYSSKKSKDHQYIFINNRYVEDKTILAAFKNFFQSYDSFSYVLFLNVPSDFVDWNAHPSKIHVRFKNSHTIFLFVQQLLNQIHKTKESLSKISTPITSNLTNSNHLSPFEQSNFDSDASNYSYLGQVQDHLIFKSFDGLYFYPITKTYDFNCSYYLSLISDFDHYLFKSYRLIDPLSLSFLSSLEYKQLIQFKNYYEQVGFQFSENLDFIISIPYFLRASFIKKSIQQSIFCIQKFSTEKFLFFYSLINNSDCSDSLNLNLFLSNFSEKILNLDQIKDFKYLNVSLM